METIGDAYIAAAGMFPRRADHAAAALRFALAMHEVASRVSVEPGEPPTRLRVGVHTGPITAGLIGRTRAKYCLFGDTARAGRLINRPVRPHGHVTPPPARPRCADEHGEPNGERF